MAETRIITPEILSREARHEGYTLADDALRDGNIPSRPPFRTATTLADRKFRTERIIVRGGTNRRVYVNAFIEGFNIRMEEYRQGVKSGG